MDEYPSRAKSAAAALEPRVSAVVVVNAARSNAQGQAPLDLCLRSAVNEPWIDDLIIIDHGAAPEITSTLRSFSADRRDVKYVKIHRDLTAAAAANIGAHHALGRWLLFLDSNVVVQRGAVARMAAAGGGAQTPWIVGGRLLDIEGRERFAARVGSLNAFSTIAVAIEWPARAPRRAGEDAAQVAAVSGALMLITRSDFQALHGFDEKFVTDYADLDLCRRAVDEGGSILFEPDAAGVQFEPPARKRRQAQGLALFASKSAKTMPERAFARIAGPALATLLWLKDFVAGRPRSSR